MKSLNISIAKNGTELRQDFIRKFTMTWDAFQISRKAWIDHAATKHYPITYETLHLWDLMDHRAISFAQSLEFLRTLPGEVYFMSENATYPDCRGITIDGVEYQGGVAQMNAAELADLIAYEWYESYRLTPLGMYLADTVLPEDIYVFDASMEHLLVFTHENDYWELELEQPMKCAASRFCMMYGFELPEAVPYDRIRAMLTAELAPDACLEMEISYSYPTYFRQFIVSKWTNEDGTGCQYWFDFDPHTNYTAWEDAENAKVFDQLSLKEISEENGVRFDVIAIDGNTL